MDDDVRISTASEGAKMTANNTKANSLRPNGMRVAVKKEMAIAMASPSATPNGSKDGAALRSLSPDNVKPSPGDTITKPDTSLLKPIRKASSLHKSSGADKPSKTVRVRFDHVPDATSDATSQFQVITDCLYGSKNMGSSDNDPLDCDCAEELHNGRNLACGEDSDCINRATKMECVDSECNCGEGCQNQRFQRKQYAQVSVIKTEKKGFGLRTDADLHPNDFIFEYIGEVINEPAFRRRMIQYDEEGIKHFYFMSLTKSEFVDATRKGNLGRFCNHSCNPNCYVDKWVVGKKLRMGIFAGRHIRAGEELVFDYNVDRYGADPQPCYCGEANCTGFIGGKTQTERATKLSQATIEALGIDDPDSWETTVAKKQRRKKPNEDDEEYVGSLQQTGLAEDGVTKVMAALMQCKEKWIAVKLLSRIQAARNDERVLNRVVRMHGYQILCSILTSFQDDNNVVLQVLDILYRFPRLTKNKISDSNIEKIVETFATSEHEDVAAESKRILEEWGKLQIAYRIPRKKFDPNAPATAFEDRRGRDVSNNGAGDTSSSVRQRGPLSPLHGMVIPKGPRSSIPQRNNGFFNATGNNSNINASLGRAQRKQQKSNVQGAALPFGWFSATDPTGNTYYYTKGGATTWKRPTQPADKAAPPPKAPSKAQQDMDAVQDIINNLTKQAHRPFSSQTPQASNTSIPEPNKEKWRSLSIEKQQKIYENTLFPSIKSVMDHFRNRLPKDEIKKFAKEISKKIVSSDYKHNRVEDPNSLSPRQQKKIKAHVRDYFERAAKKYQELEKKQKIEPGTRHGTHISNDGRSDAKTMPATEANEMTGVMAMGSVDGAGAHPIAMGGSNGSSSQSKTNGLATLDDMALTDDDDGGEDATRNFSPDSLERKRKRADSTQGVPSPSVTPSETPSFKRLKDEDAADTPTPPTPPPPPPPLPPTLGEEENEALRKREEDEEALRRENEEAMRDFEEQNKHDQQKQDAQDNKSVTSGDVATSTQRITTNGP